MQLLLSVLVSVGFVIGIDVSINELWLLRQLLVQSLNLLFKDISGKSWSKILEQITRLIIFLHELECGYCFI